MFFERALIFLSYPIFSSTLEWLYTLDLLWAFWSTWVVPRGRDAIDPQGLLDGSCPTGQRLHRNASKTTFWHQEGSRHRALLARSGMLGGLTKYPEVGRTWCT